MSAEARGVLYLVAFLWLVLSLVWLAAVTWSTLGDMRPRQPTSAQRRLGWGGGILAAGGVVMAAAAVPFTPLVTDVKVWVFWTGICVAALGVDLKIYGWHALHEGVLRARARERVRKGDQP